MAVDEELARRIREWFSGRQAVVEKRMFGGIAFMLNGHMCCGVSDVRLMARVGPDQYKDALEQPHALQMDFTGKPLRRFVFVDPVGIESDKQLGEWISRCETFVLSLPPK